MCSGPRLCSGRPRALIISRPPDSASGVTWHGVNVLAYTEEIKGGAGGLLNCELKGQSSNPRTPACSAQVLCTRQNAVASKRYSGAVRSRGRGCRQGLQHHVNSIVKLQVSTNHEQSA